MIERLEVGKDYKTRGGWKARVIFETTMYGRMSEILVGVEPDETARLFPALYVIHAPGTTRETMPIIHAMSGHAIACVGLVLGPQLPTYGKIIDHPADLVERWEK